MRSDGNLLVLGPDGDTKWESGSSCDPKNLKGCTLDMDGKLFIIGKDPPESTIWTYEKDGCDFMVIEDDGYFRAYKDQRLIYSLPEN